MQQSGSGRCQQHETMADADEMRQQPLDGLGGMGKRHTKRSSRLPQKLQQFMPLCPCVIFLGAEPCSVIPQNGSGRCQRDAPAASGRGRRHGPEICQALLRPPANAAALYAGPVSAEPSSDHKVSLAHPCSAVRCVSKASLSASRSHLFLLQPKVWLQRSGHQLLMMKTG